MMLNDDPKITVLLATFNGAKYLKEQLGSLYLQSKKIDQVLVVDDGSSDNSVELVQSFINEHELFNSWKVKINNINLGPAANFINMCKEAEGDYIFFCDQDDIWMPDKIERMSNIIKNNPDIGLLYADVINMVNLDNKPHFATQFSEEVKRIDFSASNYFYKGLGCATCITKEFMNHVIKYWTLGWEHDMFFWACSILLKKGYKYSSPVIWRRIHTSNVSIHELKTLEKRRIQIRNSLNRPLKMKELLKDNNINDDEKLKFLDGYEKTLKRRYEALMNRNIGLAVYNLIYGKDYYLYREKGAMLDLVLIIFGKYSI